MTSRRRAAQAAALLAAIALGACVAGPVEPRRAESAARPAAPSADPAPATAATRAPAAGEPAAAAAPVAAPVATAAAPPAEPGADVARLQGMSPDALRGFLGTPDFRRRDGQAEIWQYAHDDCILHVILYPSPGGLTVQHVDGRGRTRAALQWVNTRNCYARVMDIRRVSPSG